MKIKFNKYGLIFKKSYKDIINQYRKYKKWKDHDIHSTFDEDFVKNRKLKLKVYRSIVYAAICDIMIDNIERVDKTRTLELLSFFMNHLKEKYEN